MTDFDFYEPEKIEDEEMAYVFDGELHPAIKMLNEQGYGICHICGRKKELEKLHQLADQLMCADCLEFKTAKKKIKQNIEYDYSHFGGA